MGHPDKLADTVSDAVLDAMLAQDPKSRVACETMVTTGLVVVAGEITTKADVDIQTVVRNAVREVGYTAGDIGLDADTCAVPRHARQAVAGHRSGRRLAGQRRAGRR